jgi:hypothetical protein
VNIDIMIDDLINREGGYSNNPNDSVLLRMVIAQKAVRYMEIAEAKPSQETFEYGWVFNRVGEIK